MMLMLRPARADQDHGRTFHCLEGYLLRKHAESLHTCDAGGFLQRRTTVRIPFGTHE